jgi:hypothetical protein
MNRLDGVCAIGLDDEDLQEGAAAGLSKIYSYTFMQQGIEDPHLFQRLPTGPFVLALQRVGDQIALDGFRLVLLAGLHPSSSKVTAIS